MTDKPKKLFSDETISEVQRSWKLINTDLQAAGVDILLRLFKKYPTYQQLFNAFKDTPESELKSQKEFLKHALNVAEALNRAIAVLDDTEKLSQLLIMIGKSHVKRNITPEHFSNLEKIILQTIQEALANNWTEKVASGWKEVLSAAVATIMKGAES